MSKANTRNHLTKRKRIRKAKCLTSKTTVSGNLRISHLTAKKSKMPVRKRGAPKYFNMSESNSDGMDNGWSVIKKKNGFYLTGNEIGQVGDACETISEALDYDGQQYSGGTVEIDTNVDLEELSDIMAMSNFEPFLHNTESLMLNGVEVDMTSFRHFVAGTGSLPQLIRPFNRI